MSPEKVIPKEEFSLIVDRLREEGYRVIAPVVKEGVILFDEISSFSEMARGVSERQKKGYYRLVNSEEWFGYVHGPNSLKHFLHSSETRILRARPDLSAEVLLSEEKLAFIGVRGCDLASLHLLDKVFLGDQPDTHYGNRKGRCSLSPSTARDLREPASA